MNEANEGNERFFFLLRHWRESIGHRFLVKCSGSKIWGFGRSFVGVGGSDGKSFWGGKNRFLGKVVGVANRLFHSSHQKHHFLTTPFPYKEYKMNIKKKGGGNTLLFSQVVELIQPTFGKFLRGSHGGGKANERTGGEKEEGSRAFFSTNTFLPPPFSNQTNKKVRGRNETNIQRVQTMFSLSIQFRTLNYRLSPFGQPRCAIF